MAKHRKPPHRWAATAALAGAAAVAPMVIAAHIENPAPLSGRDTAPLTYVYGVGGTSDKLGARIPAKLNGQIITPTDTFVPIGYPAGIPIDPSVKTATPLLAEAVAALPSGQKAVVMGYSQGAIVTEYLRRDLETRTDAPKNGDLKFIELASPTVPNGGIYARFDKGILPGFTSTGPAAASRYDTTYVTLEYDPASDFPAYFNVLSIVNSLAAFVYVHPDAPYDAATIDPLPPLTKAVTNPAGGTDTYMFVRTEQLPILQPLRDVSALVGTTGLTEPILSAVEPPLRVLVDMGYTDRQNLNPEVPVPFSLVTPPEKKAEAAVAMPEAIRQGRENFRTAMGDRPKADESDTRQPEPRKPETRRPDSRRSETQHSGSRHSDAQEAEAPKPVSQDAEDAAPHQRPSTRRSADPPDTDVDKPTRRRPDRTERHESRDTEAA